MDVWNTWDKEVIQSVANEKSIYSSIDLKQTLTSHKALSDLGRKLRQEKREHEKEMKEEYEKQEYERKGLAHKIPSEKKKSTTHVKI